MSGIFPGTDGAAARYFAKLYWSSKIYEIGEIAERAKGT